MARRLAKRVYIHTEEIMITHSNFVRPSHVSASFGRVLLGAPECISVLSFHPTLLAEDYAPPGVDTAQLNGDTGL